jgi:hypothetical protein
VKVFLVEQLPAHRKPRADQIGIWRLERREIVADVVNPHSSFDV